MENEEFKIGQDIFYNNKIYRIKTILDSPPRLVITDMSVHKPNCIIVRLNTVAALGIKVVKEKEELFNIY